MKAAAIVYALGTLIHTLDHFRRGAGSVTWEVVEIGTVGTVLAAVAITLVLAEHRLGPLAAVAVGIPHAIGIAAVHWLPSWGVLSDSFIGATGISPLSWIAVVAEVGGALGMGIAGAYALTRRGGDPGTAGTRASTAAGSLRVP